MDGFKDNPPIENEPFISEKKSVTALLDYLPGFD